MARSIASRKEAFLCAAEAALVSNAYHALICAGEGDVANDLHERMATDPWITQLTSSYAQVANGVRCLYLCFMATAPASMIPAAGVSP